MPRYFFNVADGSASPDREGTELLDLAEARLEAVRLTGQMFLDDPEEFWRTGEWWVQVADGYHVTLFTLYTTAADGPGVRPSRRAAPDPAAEARAPNTPQGRSLEPRRR